VVANNSQPKVLVVDDDPLMRWSLAESLGERGFAVTEAGDGRTTIAAIERAAKPFDVVLLDYRLPDSTDLRLLQRVKTLAPTSQVIMMTSYIYDVAPSAGASAYRIVSKPFEIDRLATLVREARDANLSGVRDEP
jgi:DNA-binding NtrC family response regulator